MRLKKCRILSAIFFIASGISFAQTSDLLYQQGTEALKSSNYGSAELIFRKIVERKDDYEEVSSYNLAYSLFRQNKFDAAIFEFNRFQLLSRTQDLIDKSRFYLAESHFMKNDYLKAIEDYKRYLSQSKTKDEAMIFSSFDRIGSVYFRQERYDEAVIEWKKSLENVPKDRDIQQKIKIANALLKSAKYDEALLYLEPISGVVRDQNSAAMVNLMLGQIYQQTDKDKIALKFLNKIPDILLKDEAFVDVLFYRGLSYYKTGDNPSAISNLNSYLSFGKARPLYYEALFAVSLVLGEKDVAEARKGFFEVNNNTTNRNLKRKSSKEIANLYINSGDYVSAIPFLEDAAVYENGQADMNLMFSLGDAYLLTKKYDLAIDIYRKMDELFHYEREMDKVYFLTAVAYSRKGDSKSAEEYMRKMDEINPFSDYKNEMKFYRGVNAFDDGNHSLAASLFRDYLKNAKAEKKYDSYRYIFQIGLLSGDFKSSTEGLDSLIRRYPKSVENAKATADYFGKFYSQIKNIQYYENYMAKSFPDSPYYAAIISIKGLSLFDYGDYKKAEAAFTEFLKIRGNDSDIDIFHKKAQCLFSLGRYSDVVKFLTEEKITRYDEKITTDLVRLLALSYYKTGEYEKAYSSYFIIIDEIINQEDLFTVFDLSIRQKDLPTAKALADRLRSNRKFYEEALFKLGVLNRSFSNISIAKDYFNSIIAEFPDSEFADGARLELARIDLNEYNYDSAVNKLNAVKSARFAKSRSVLTIKANFRLEKYDSAIALLKADISKISGEEDFSEVISTAFEYSKMKKSVEGVKFFGSYLLKLSAENANEVNFSTAMVLYENASFREALNYINRVSDDPKNQSQADYIKCMIFSNMKNYQNASNLVGEMMKKYDASDVFRQKAEMEFALICIEKGNIDKASEVLGNLALSGSDREVQMSAKRILENMNRNQK